MNKDVIYIDVDDDITAIISKVKASNEKIVALVPPKRIGILQSAVNLRLLMRSAEQSDKRVVLITANSALLGLAAAAKMPVARNLQTKPELVSAQTTPVDDEEDIIDGKDLPVGMHAGMPIDDESAKSAAVASGGAAASRSVPPKTNETSARAKNASIPNFNTFRKKLIFGGLGGVFLIAFLVWAFVFAPRATVIVSAKTNDTSVNDAVTVGESLPTDADSKTIKATFAKKTENKSVDFAPSGSKNVGEKAGGSVTFTNNSQSSTTVASGTTLTTSGGLNFVTTQSVTIPAGTISCNPFPRCNGNSGSASGSVTAAEAGAKYNTADGSLSGAPANIEASFANPASGGTDKIAKVVTAADVQKAKEQLVSQENDAMKSQLKTSFKSGAKPIDASYGVDYANVTSSPAIGADTDSDTAKLSASVTYRMAGLSSPELDKYLNNAVGQRIQGQKDQKVYENGRASASFQDVKAAQNGFALTLIATAKIGPQLNEQEIKNDAKGKKGGEIQASLQAVAGIEDVDVRYFPFWVSSVPNDDKKITVQFKVND